MKTLKIQVRSVKDADAEALEVAKKLDLGQKVLYRNNVYFESIDALRNLLTENRLNVWRCIRDKKPESISELAKLLKRDFRVVHTDVQILKRVGLVKVTKEAGLRGDRQKPLSLVDRLELRVA